MASRIIIGGRPLGSGKYGGDPKCLCGEPARILGRCEACHDALVRRRRGLPPNTEAEGKRLAAYLEKHQAEAGRCPTCRATVNEEHRPGCTWAGEE